MLRRWLLGAAVLALLAAPGCSSASLTGPLVGVWHVHTNYLTIDQNGKGTFRWPTHVFCGDGPPPCDTISSQGVITDGGHARLVLTGIRGVDATGTVSGSSEPTVVPDGQVRLHLGPNDVLHLTFESSPSIGAYEYVCGPRTDRSKTNCGA